MKKVSPLITSWFILTTTAAFIPPYNNRHNLGYTQKKLELEMASEPSYSSSQGEIYNIPGSGWRSSTWNWGSAMGTGHDCAKICRERYATRDARSRLIDSLLNPPSPTVVTESLSDPLIDARSPPFEEVKLVLGLAWQRGRWDGSDGGRGGYGDVLAHMAAAQRYEGDGEEGRAIATRRLISDMQMRFHLIAADDAEDAKLMNELLLEGVDVDLDVARRKCAGMVLKAMGFIDLGL